MFPDQVRLTKVVPDENQHRFYLMRTLPDLFGSCGLLREWGRMGSPGRVRLDWGTRNMRAASGVSKPL